MPLNFTLIRKFASAVETVAKGSLGKKVSKGPSAARGSKEVPIVTDPKLLVSHCSNLNFRDNQNPHVKLGPDNAYPAWLWEMHTTYVPVPLEQMDRSTPTARARYWERLSKLNNKRRAVLVGIRGWYERIDGLSSDDRMRLMYGVWIDRLEEWKSNRSSPQSNTREFGGPGARLRDAPYSPIAGPRHY